MPYSFIKIWCIKYNKNKNKIDLVLCMTLQINKELKYINKVNLYNKKDVPSEIEIQNVNRVRSDIVESQI